MLSLSRKLIEIGQLKVIKITLKTIYFEISYCFCMIENGKKNIKLKIVFILYFFHSSISTYSTIFSISQNNL